MNLPDPAAVLALTIPDFYGGLDQSLREYLNELLQRLWVQGSDFSSKRPFGDGNWQWCVYRALVKAGYITGVLDDDGDCSSADIFTANIIVTDAIQHMCKEPT
jgi:hypothetical protein